MKNDYDLNKHKKSDKIKWIAVFLCVILLAVTVTAAITQGFKNWNPYGWLDKKQEQNEPQGVIDGDGNQMETGTVYEMPAKMSFTAAALAAANEQGVTITLQATVLPVDAQNKSVDWVVEWNTAETNGESPVTDFVTVTPQADGSNIVNVTCFKSFGNDTILIRVTTRDGGFSAFCIVSFVGHPSSLSITPTGTTAVTDSGWNVPIANIYSGKKYDFDLVFDNIYHSVDKNFVPIFTCEVVGVGTYKLHRTISEKGTIVTDDTITVSPTDKVKVKQLGVTGEIDYDVMDMRLMKASIQGGKLHFDVYSTIQSLNFQQAYNSARTSYYKYNFESYTDVNKRPYFQIKVTETNTGISQTVNVRIESNVTGVTLNNSELTF